MSALFDLAIKALDDYQRALERGAHPRVIDRLRARYEALEARVCDHLDSTVRMFATVGLTPVESEDYQ